MDRHYAMQALLGTVSTLAMTTALAYIAPTGPIPITAEQAFDAVATGCIGSSSHRVCYGVGKVALVDVRTQEELAFSGGPAKVDEIVLKTGYSFTPDYGKVKYVINADGQYLQYRVQGVQRSLNVAKTKEVVTSLIGTLAPCSKYYPEENAFKPDEPGFSEAMARLAEQGVTVPITMCSSGGRSTQCPLNFLYKEVQDMFEAFYEIDRAGDIYITPPAFGLPPFVEAGAPPPGIHMATLGGYQGSDYGGDYNGLTGFVNRRTGFQPIAGWTNELPFDVRFRTPSGPSVSWKDSGLPIYIPAVACILPQ